MSEAIRFLHALAQAMSTLTLYSPGHPATKRGAETLWESINALLALDERPVFLFLGTSPVYNGRALHELRDWQQSARLADVGVQRMEFDRSLTVDSVHQMLERLLQRLSSGIIPGESRETPIPGIVFGTVAVQEEEAPETGEPEAAPTVGESEPQLDLTDELEAIRFVRSEARRGVVARAEVEAVARILGNLLDEFRLPQAIPTADPEQYHLVHPANTALLAMAAGSASGVDAAGIHRLGVMALLHDIGMARIPAELGNRERLDDAERALVETHTVEGARLLLESGGRGLELAATVCFEHHLRTDGSGYPHRRFRPATHWASRLIGCCGALTALRAARPFRPAWTTDRAVLHLEEGAGTVFDADAARLVAGVVMGR
jgi:HD-GYP domain-containing protein (c-di-GMP phosphodiesterase class II)